MKMIICLAALIAVALAAPLDEPDVATVLRYVMEDVGVEGYKYGFETSDGITKDESGQLENVGTEDEALEVRGSFAYPGPDGVVYTVTYTAGKAGFVPSGDHIPKAEVN